MPSGKTTLKSGLRKMAGTGHLPAAEKKRLREERQARREYAVRLAAEQSLAEAPPDGANRQTDPVCEHFARPSVEPAPED